MLNNMRWVVFQRLIARPPSCLPLKWQLPAFWSGQAHILRTHCYAGLDRQLCPEMRAGYFGDANRIEMRLLPQTLIAFERRSGSFIRVNHRPV